MQRAKLLSMRRVVARSLLPVPISRTLNQREVARGSITPARKFRSEVHMPSNKRSSSSSRSRSSSRGRTASKSQVTTDHDEIQKWVEERNGKPACVKGTGGRGDAGVLRIDYPGYSG